MDNVEINVKLCKAEHCWIKEMLENFLEAGKSNIYIIKRLSVCVDVREGASETDNTVFVERLCMANWFEKLFFFGLTEEHIPVFSN